MEPLNLKSDLESFIDSVPATGRAKLAESEYQAAIELFCTEKKRHAPGRRHADTIDFDRPAMDLVIDLVPKALAAKRRGDDRETLKINARIGALTAAALLQAANDKLDDLFAERAFSHRWRAQRDEIDHHADEYRAEAIAQRNTETERMRDLLAEVAR
jgi:hypothetical protein